MASLKTFLGTSVALLALSGCASLQHQQDRLAPSLLGQHESALTARYGHPLVMGTYRAYRVGQGSTVVSTRVHAPVSGYVGNTPFEGTATVPGETYEFPAYCTIQVGVDAAGVVQSVQLRGDAAVCRKVLG